MHVTQQVLNYLIGEAKKVGKKEAEKWVHKQLKEHGYNALSVAERIGKKAINGLEKLFKKEHKPDFQDAAMAYCANKKGHDLNEKLECIPSQSKKPTTTQMTGQKRDLDTHEEHNMGGAPEEGGEQQVTRPHKVWRRFPNTETAALKWVMTHFLGSGAESYPPYEPFDDQDEQSTTSLLTSGGGAWSNPAHNSLNQTYGTNLSTPQLFQYRMTSPYNIMKTLQNLGGTVGNSQPNWLEYFDSKYQYYHVMETEWELNFKFGVPYTGTDGTGTTLPNYQTYGAYIFWKYTNEDDPPTQYAITATSIANAKNVGVAPATGENIAVTQLTGGAGTYNLSPDDYFRMGGWHHKHVKFNTTHDTQVTIEGKYKFGQCKMDIKTISTSDAHSSATTAEGWGQCGSTPAFPEILSVIIVQDNACYNNINVKVPTSLRSEIEQLIQFRDLRSAYKFPTPALSTTSGATTNITTDAVFFWRGAGYT